MKPLLIIDIETIPRPVVELEKLMPPDMLNPTLPPELENPEMPNFEEKAPSYGLADLQSKFQALKALENPTTAQAEKQRTAADKLTEAENKRALWIESARSKWQREIDDGRERFRLDSIGNRARFIDKAALDPARGQVKLIGVSIFTAADTPPARTVFAWEPDRQIVERLAAMEKAENAKGDMVSSFAVHCFLFEKQALNAALEFVQRTVRPKDTPSGRPGKRPRARIVTFYGNIFDIPFLARRGAICHAPGWFNFVRRWRRGRYLDGEVFVDLCEEWKIADRETHTGGLNGLAKTLGYPLEKIASGATFYQFYQQDPTEGIYYLLNDLDMTAHVARCLGLLA